MAHSPAQVCWHQGVLNEVEGQVREANVRFQTQRLKSCLGSWLFQFPITAILKGFIWLVVKNIWLVDNVLVFPGGSEESTASVGAPGDMGSIPGSGRYPGRGNGNPLLYSCLG